MKAPDHFNADGETAMWVERWAGHAASALDEADIEQLFAMLDKPWFCRRHNVLFEMREHGQERVIHITRRGIPAAIWTAQGQTLVFVPANGGEEERAGTLDCAISITCDFLDHARIKPGARQREAAI